MTTQLSMLSAVHDRDRILGAFAENHRVYLESLRSFAREIAQRNGTVTVDDVRAEITAREFPMPKEIGADERLLGSLFRSKDFVPVAQRATSRTAWAARVGIARSAVTVYRLAAA